MAGIYNITERVRDYLIAENLVQVPEAAEDTPTLPECYIDPPLGLGEPSSTRPMLAAVYLDRMPALPSYEGCWRDYQIRISIKSLGQSAQHISDLYELHEQIRLRFTDYTNRFNLDLDGLNVLHIIPVSPMEKANFGGNVPARNYPEYYAAYNMRFHMVGINDI